MRTRTARAKAASTWRGFLQSAPGSRGSNRSLFTSRWAEWPIIMGSSGEPVRIRTYDESDFSDVAALWTRVNREFATPNTRELFEQYISTAIDGELKHLEVIFSEARRNAFWVVEAGKQIAGTFGIESRNKDDTELRRMYL